MREFHWDNEKFSLRDLWDNERFSQRYWETFSKNFTEAGMRDFHWNNDRFSRSISLKEWEIFTDWDNERLSRRFSRRKWGISVTIKRRSRDYANRTRRGWVGGLHWSGLVGTCEPTAHVRCCWSATIYNVVHLAPNTLFPLHLFTPLARRGVGGGGYLLGLWTAWGQGERRGVVGVVAREWEEGDS